MPKIQNVFITVAFMFAVSSASASDLKVFADEPLQFALIKIGKSFQEETGHKVEYVFAPAPVIVRRISGGEVADVVIVQPNFIATMTTSGQLSAGEHPAFTRIGFGFGVRTKTASSDVATPASLKQALTAADLIVASNRASGDHFMKVVGDLGLADTVGKKIVRLEPADVFNRVIQGSGNDIAVGTITQIKGNSGLKFIGALPGAMQSNISYATAATANSKSPEAAKAFVAYVMSSKGKADFVAAGGE